ncbi:hypothetical protein EW026_g5351 [Hermanssonia centrifuga]|uniref:Uncharacterized protein n=1 Tax=Hermanssonia centrifuga TaxID=98765 RepID=A0A4S4KEC4_9APHY|nr:hypothetical protein EW026_g5351 [Hermanssonia centrifuga]
MKCTIEKVDDVYHIVCKYRGFNVSFVFTPTTNSQKSEVHLEAIAIDSRGWMYNMMKVDWKKSDTLASRLPDLQAIVIGFGLQDDMSRFVNDVVNTKMENMRSVGKLKYAIFNGSDYFDNHDDSGGIVNFRSQVWMRASPDSAELEPTTFERKDLWLV